MASASSSPLSEFKSTPTPPPPTTNPVENYEDSHLIQMMILDQQMKGRPGYIPKMINITSRPSRLDGVIGNHFLCDHGGLLCKSCVSISCVSDRTLWDDLNRHIHLALPVELRIGPDVDQCFCGYFSFRPEDVERHLESSKQMLAEEGQDWEVVVAGLVDRIERIGMHKKCRAKLIAKVNEAQNWS